MKYEIPNHVGVILETAMRTLHLAHQLPDVGLVTRVLNELAKELGLPETVTFEPGADPDAYHHIRNVTINGVTGGFMVFPHGKLFRFEEQS